MSKQQRTFGLLRATGVGVGAIVGGGILVLAGVAFRATGPGAIAAFAANGLIALLTALTFAEMSTSFPESGGAYTYAKKVLSVRVAFAVGWVLWFAYIVAGVLYALGFAEFAVAILAELYRVALGDPPAWLASRTTVNVFALAAVAGYTLSLIRSAGGGGQWATVGKVIVFAFLIVAGLWILVGRPDGAARAGLTPFFPGGGLGLLQAMGFTFIALQGFEIIAAVAGEVQNPARTLPRAMLLSLGAALAIYLPLLFVISTAGVAPGQSITAMSEADPETVIATAVRNYLGPTGYWLVMVAAVLSTLSALQANILAASRVAHSMAQDRTLPGVLIQLSRRKTPVMALYASALAVVVILMLVPNLAAAGAAASLIFLVSFALAHWTGFLARRRAGDRHREGSFLTPWFPSVQVVGGAACAVLAVFQAVAVPAAGGITFIWLALGVILYVALFARRAQMVDAFAEAVDPELVRYRGRSPLVLVPVANPRNAPALAALAGALAPRTVGRVLLLSVVRHKGGGADRADAEVVGRAVKLAQEGMREALTASLVAGQSPEALITVAPEPWDEIARVADTYRCESLLLGLHRLDQPPEGVEGEGGAKPLERLLNDVHCDVSIIRALPGWHLEQARRVLIPIGGKGAQDELRARLLGSLCRTGARELTFLSILPAEADGGAVADARTSLTRLAALESPTASEVLVIQADDVVGAISERAGQADLVILGLPRFRGRKLISKLAVRVAERVRCATIMISRHD
jgi:amino acid transporter